MRTSSPSRTPNAFATHEICPRSVGWRGSIIEFPPCNSDWFASSFIVTTTSHRCLGRGDLCGDELKSPFE